MARPALKRWWAGSLPAAFERATFVHAANLVLFALVLFWQPIPDVVWDISQPVMRTTLWVLFALGWVLLFAGGLSFGLFDLLGLTQMWRWYQGLPAQPLRLKTHWLYEWVRHPMYVGVLLGVWATPRMTAGHLMLAAGFTLYVLIAMRYEERDLARAHGDAYRRWREARA